MIYWEDSERNPTTIFLFYYERSWVTCPNKITIERLNKQEQIFAREDFFLFFLIAKFDESDILIRISKKICYKLITNNKNKIIKKKKSKKLCIITVYNITRIIFSISI